MTAATAYAIQLSTTTVAVGDTLTLTPEPAGVEALEVVRCVMVIERPTDSEGDWVRMQAASDDCAPWTVTIPSSKSGEYQVYGWLFSGTGVVGASTSIEATAQTLQIVAGTSAPFTSNYPVQSWAVEDLVSDPTPAYGSPVTVIPPSGVEGCMLAVFAGFERSSTYQYDGCDPWTVTFPAPQSNAVAQAFLPSSDIHYSGWTGTSAWDDDRPLAPFMGARYGETYSLALGHFEGDTGGAYASDLPAIFTGPARDQVFYNDDPSDHPYEPVLIGITDGACESNHEPLQAPVTQGSCGAFLVPPASFTGNGSDSFYLWAKDPEGRLVADAHTSIGFVDRMTPIDLEVPAEVDTGEDLPIDASNDAGVPAQYEIVLEPVLTTASISETAASSAITFSGSFSPSVNSAGDQVTVVANDIPAGTYDVTATFTDVLNGTRATTRRVNVASGADTIAPNGTVTIAGGRAYTRTTAVTVAVPATDAGAGLSQVQLSNNGTTWATRPYAASQPWTLPATNGTRTVYVRWKDAAGNWSPVKTDTIVLDTVAPTASEPRRGLVANTSIHTGRITLRVPWSGTDATSGIARYELLQSTDGGPWTTVSTTLTGPTVDRSLASLHTYRFRVRAIDRAGNVGAWVFGSSFRLSRYSESNSAIRYSGPWAKVSSPVYWGGAAKRSGTAGARATLTVTGRSVAWVARTGPNRGVATVYVNGTKVATVDLRTPAYGNQRVVWARNWSSSVARTITIRVTGTAGHPLVDIDAFVTAN